MKCVGLSLALLGAILMSVDVANAQAPSWSPPPESQRCPSKRGENDERGSANHMSRRGFLMQSSSSKQAKSSSSGTS